MKELSRKIYNAFQVATSNNYDQDVDPENYERYVMGKFRRRDLLARDVSDVLEENLPSSEVNQSAILDLASGTGIISRELAGRGHRVTAFDLSQNSLKHLHDQFPSITTVQGDINEPLPFKENTFQGITTVWANRFIQNSDEFLTEVYRVLEPNGIFVWPLFSTEIPIWKAKAGIKQPTTPDSLAEVVKSHGFSKTTTIKQFLYGNIFNKTPVYPHPSYVIAKK